MWTSCNHIIVKRKRVRMSLFATKKYTQETLTVYTWTENTDNSARETLVSGQVASLHIL